MSFLPHITDGFAHNSNGRRTAGITDGFAHNSNGRKTTDSFMSVLPNQTGGQANLKFRKGQLSAFGIRANERVENAKCTIDEMLSARNAERGDDRDGVSDVSRARARFDEISRGIDALRGSENVPSVSLRPNDVVREDLPMRAMRFYRIALPVRPALAVVEVTPETGSAPQVFGSLEHMRPNAKQSEFRMQEEGMLQYNHALDVEEYDGVVDRTKAVPKARELYISVTALTGDCVYNIKATFQRPRIVLTRAELAAKTKSKRSGADAKIEELQRDPAAQLQFQDHLDDLKREHKIKGDGLIRRDDIVKKRDKPKRDIKAENKAAVLRGGSCSPENQYRRKLVRAVNRCRKEDDISSTLDAKSMRSTCTSAFSFNRTSSCSFWRPHELSPDPNLS